MPRPTWSPQGRACVEGGSRRSSRSSNEKARAPGAQSRTARYASMRERNPSLWGRGERWATELGSSHATHSGRSAADSSLFGRAPMAVHQAPDSCQPAVLLVHRLMSGLVGSTPCMRTSRHVPLRPPACLLQPPPPPARAAPRFALELCKPFGMAGESAAGPHSAVAACLEGKGHAVSTAIRHRPVALPPAGSLHFHSIFGFTVCMSAEPPHQRAARRHPALHRLRRPPGMCGAC